MLRSQLLYDDRTAAVENDIWRFLRRPYGDNTAAVRRPYGRLQYFRGRRLDVEV